MSNRLPFETTIEVRDTCLCLHAQRAARALARRFDEALKPFGLTNGQFSLLMSLNRPEPPSLGPVARLLAMDRTTLTAALFERVIDIDGVAHVDFGTGDDPYKRDWMEKVRTRWKLTCLRPANPRNWSVMARHVLRKLVQVASDG